MDAILPASQLAPLLIEVLEGVRREFNNQESIKISRRHINNLRIGRFKKRTTQTGYFKVKGLTVLFSVDIHRTKVVSFSFRLIPLDIEFSPSLFVTDGALISTAMTYPFDIKLIEQENIPYSSEISRLINAYKNIDSLIKSLRNITSRLKDDWDPLPEDLNDCSDVIIDEPLELEQHTGRRLPS